MSVVKPGQSKGKSYAEWDAQRKGTSWKAKLKAAIDIAIPQAKDFDDFLRLMQAQGYEIKPGKFISFRAPGQERFTRCKTLGEAYTEEAIKERIKGRVITRVPKERKGISLRIDLENDIKAQQSAGYEKWVTLHNLKQAAKALNFLTEHGIDTYPDLESRVAEITAASDEAAAALKAMEHRLADMAGLSGAVFAPLFKTAAIGILAQLAGTICRDSGQQALAQAVHGSGAAAAAHHAGGHRTAVEAAAPGAAALGCGAERHPAAGDAG